MTATSRGDDPKSNIKQFGDACEHYVVAMLGFANVPGVKMPDNWPGYDIVAELRHSASPQRIAVQGRRWPNSGLAFRLKSTADWDWFAAVLHHRNGRTGCWILPRQKALLLSTKMPVVGKHRLNVKVLQNHPEWENNFAFECGG